MYRFTEENASKVRSHPTSQQDWTLNNFAEKFEFTFRKPLTVPKEKDVLQYLCELGFLTAIPAGMCGVCRFEVDLSYWDEHMDEMRNFPVDKSRVNLTTELIFCITLYNFGFAIYFRLFYFSFSLQHLSSK